MFRALKTRGKTPKYGLIFNSSFIGRAGQKNKGRISRYLANKCAIASRIDSFTEGTHQTNLFGEKLRSQMEERLNFLASGTKPKKNTEAMQEVIEELKREGLYYDGSAAGKNATTKKDKKKADKKKKADSDSDEVDSDEEDKKKKQKKDKKKDKKRKQRDSSDEEEVEEVKPKKKKQKN